VRRNAFLSVFLVSAASVYAAAQPAGKIPITTRSEQARTLFLRARALNETLQPHEAHALFEQAVAADPAFAMGEYYLASTAPTAKELAEHLQKAVALASHVSPGERLTILAFQARNHAEPARARQLAESLTILYPRDERAHSALGILYSGTQQYDKAIVEYQKAIELDPKYSIAYNQLGYAYRSVRKMEAAEAVFRKYIALIPNDPNPYDSYAELLMKSGRFAESIAQYRKALSLDPHFGGSHVGIAANEMLSGRHGDAIAELEKYYDTARNDTERRTALLNEAMVNVDRLAAADALHAMERSLAIARATSDTANMVADKIVMADILLEAGRLDAARDTYNQAHQLAAASTLPIAVKQDDDLAWHYNMARVALAQHDLGAARAEAAAYLSGAAARKNDARVRQAHELNGLIALHDKHYEESLTELAMADQESPAVWYAMARAHAGKGDVAKAKEMSDAAVRMNILPTFPYVFTRAAIAGATHSATSESVRGRPH
jgi:tetratricopeptide (TPR) repeat protein